MKNLIIALILFATAGFLAFKLFQKTSLMDAPEPEPAPQPLSFPAEMELVRLDGSRVMVRLLGRDATLIEFERLADQMRFHFEIAGLDAATQEQVLRYPVTGITPIEEPEPEPVVDAESLHVEQLRAAIAKIDSKLKSLQVQYAASSSSADRRRIQLEAEKLNAERLTLAADIAERTGVELERRKPAELRNRF